MSYYMWYILKERTRGSGSGVKRGKSKYRQEIGPTIACVIQESHVYIRRISFCLCLEEDCFLCLAFLFFSMSFSSFVLYDLKARTSMAMFN